MANIRRTNSRTLRDIAAREEMDSTSSLVQIYNETIDEMECHALFNWLEQYLQVVCQSAPEVFSLKQLYEFGKLGGLRRNDARTMELVNQVFCYLRKHIKPEQSCSLNVILALEAFLSTVSATYLKQGANNVASLIQNLLVMTDPSHNLINSATYVVHISYLLVLEKALMALRGIDGSIDRNTQTKSGVDSVKESVKQRLKSIMREHKYYPIAFQAYVIKQNIKMHFLNNLCLPLFDVGRYVFLFLGSGLHSCQGMKERMEPKFDLDSIFDGIKETRQAISEGVPIKDSSYCEISLATFEAMGSNDFNIFMQCFETLGSWEIKWKTPSKSLMIKYTLLMHLCLFFHGELSQTIQDQAMNLLRDLALDERHSRWRSDPVLYEGFLEVITSIAVKYSHHQAACFFIFSQMQSSRDEAQVKTITNFLGMQTFEEKVRGLQIPRNDENRRTLFHIVKAHAGINQSFFMCASNQKLLIENYKDDKFAMVPLIMGLHQEKHVKDFDFNLVMYEKVFTQNNNEDLFNQSDYNQVANNVQRTMRVKKSITIQEIFRKQDEIVSGPIDEKQVVLVIGNPGTGKTSLSKRLCYDWANGNWGSIFTHVYLLRVRQLSRGIRGSQMDLIQAIVNLCYIADHQCGCEEAMYEEVRDRLQDKTTLLILDGLDEGDSEAWELVHLSMEQTCSLLLLSRPHNVQRVRNKSNSEIECLEFSDEHLKSYIAKELPKEEVEDFLQFMNRSSSIWEAARVPVNAQIICNIWISAAKEELKTMKIMNLAWLYDQMVNYVWMRYTKKEDVDVKVGEKESVLNSLESIAFESFKLGKVEIPENLVIEHSKTDSDAILRDAGFLLFVQEGQAFQFAHLTFHEYFASRYLAKMLNSNDNREKRKAKRFISEHKYRGASRVVFAFMIGIYCRDDDVEESLEYFKTIVNIIDDDPVEAIGWQHTFLKMRALDTFLTCCPNTNDLRSKNAQINEIVSEAVEVVKDWVEIYWDFSAWRKKFNTHPYLWDQIINDLGNMPNLHREYSCFLEMLVNVNGIHWIYEYGKMDQIINIARWNPQVVRKNVPPILNEINTYNLNAWYSWDRWMCIYSKINEECATDALLHLLEAYKRFAQRIHWHFILPALVLLEVFQDNEEVKQIILYLSQHSDSKVRKEAIQQITRHSFQPRSNAELFAWSLQKRGMQDTDNHVKGAAFFYLSRRGNQTMMEEISKMIEILTKEIHNPYSSKFAAVAIHFLLKTTLHKENRLLSLLKEMCLQEDEKIKENAAQVVWDMYSDSLLKNEKLLSFVSSICQDGDWDIQFALLPLLCILEAESQSLSTNLVEAMANGSIKSHKRIKKLALACKEAREILSNNTMNEVQTKFEDLQDLTQLEILDHIHCRKLFTLETSDDVARMALICIEKNNRFRILFDEEYGKDVAFLLLKDIAKEFKLPMIVLKKLAKRQHGLFKPRRSNFLDFDSPIVSIIRKQPVDHLLNYYFKSKDYHIVPAIAEKLLLTPVTFTKISKSKVKLTTIDSGNLAERHISLLQAQHFLSLCEKCLDKYFCSIRWRVRAPKF